MNRLALIVTTIQIRFQEAEPDAANKTRSLFFGRDENI